MSRLKILFLIIISIISFPAFAYENTVYIWQRNWDNNVNDSINTLSNESDSFAVLCGDLKVKNGKAVIDSVSIDWSALVENKINVTLVFRINAKANKFFSSDDVYEVSKVVKKTIANIIKASPNQKIIGIQFDYDCPTAKLKGYEKFIKTIKKDFKKDSSIRADLDFSITALPTWLKSRDFKKLVKQTSFYVLQLHAFEKPKNIEDANNIFFKNKSKSYLKSALKINHPFYLSLPTYGYEVVFSKAGDFLGLRAEVSPMAYEKGVIRKTVMTQAEDIIPFTNYLKSIKNQSFRGVYWFRMPIKTDEFNWDMKTLLAVFKNQTPTISIKKEISKTKDNLYEVYLLNQGEQNVFDKVKIDISWLNKKQPFYDVINNYQYTEKEGGIEIVGLAPKVGQKILIAWFREVETKKDYQLIQTSEVEIVEDNN